MESWTTPTWECIDADAKVATCMYIHFHIDKLALIEYIYVNKSSVPLFVIFVP